MKACLALMSLTILLAGCGGASVEKFDDPVSVKVRVSRGGKPVNNVKFNFQPIGDGLPAVETLVNGEFQREITPGTYTWFLSAGEKPADFASIPASFHSGAMDRQFEISSSTGELDLKVD